MSTTETQAISGITVANVAAPDDRAWKLAVQCLNDGLSDVEAIPPVYDALVLPRTLDGVAAIISAIYANNYWVKTRMDPEPLARALAATGLWIIDDCRKAAAKALQTWRGLWVRANFSPLAPLPKSGNLLASPDVPSNGPQPLTRDALLLNWGRMFRQPAVVGTNFANARAQSVNLPVPVTEARARLYWADTSLNVPPPDKWQPMFVAGADNDVLRGKTAGPIAPSGLAASGTFEFRPPKAGHYCMATLASTEFFDNPLPDPGTGNFDLQAWLKYNGAAGWCNLDVTGRVGARALKLYNHDGQAERFEIEAHCHGLAEGTEVSIESPDLRLSASARAGGAAQVVRSGAVSVPANYEGEVTVRTSVEELPAGASICVRLFWHLDSGHRHYADAVAQEQAHAAAAAGETVRVEVGSYTYLGGAAE